MSDDAILKAIKVHEDAAAALRASLSGETVVAIILDESGSMGSTRAATISGINEYMQDRVKDVPNGKLFLTKFNNKSTMLYEAVKVTDYVPLTEATYNPNGGTALLDAVGDTLEAIGRMQNLKKAIILIVTDGEENASSRFTRDKVKSMINHRENKDDRFTFVFMGANQDAWSGASSLGMGHRGNTFQYHASSTLGAMRGMSAGANAVYSSCMTNSTNFAGAAGISNDLTTLPEDSQVLREEIQKGIDQINSGQTVSPEELKSYLKVKRLDNTTP